MRPDLPTSISLDMFIAFRGPFHGDWMLWLGDEEVSRLSPQQKAGLPHLPFEEKAQYFFRLSFWTKSKRSFDAVDIVDIPDVQEIYVERVAGIKLFVASTNSPKLAEGNASRVEVVTKVDDDEPEPDSAAPNSQTSEGIDSDGTLTGPTGEVMSPPNTNTPSGCAESMLPKSEGQTKISEGDSVGAKPAVNQKCLAPTNVSAQSKCAGGMPLKAKSKNKTSKKLKRE
ncbi:hypothetical protein DVH05_014746 [Phytophthora capsici]|nr:hypothetical protein DVH05_016414 [Phytophthora capsici]KAG1698791.1 hypothetical protein DVH05_014746 [Phytophthora capsici]